MRNYWLLFLALPVALGAQSAGPAISIDAGAARHPISPDIYGINEYGVPATPSADPAQRLPFTTRRWGGDTSTRYNWKLDSHNLAGDWFFEVFPEDHPKDDPVNVAQLPDNSAFDKFVARSQGQRIKSLGTMPILPWATKNRATKTCSYSIAKYGPQQQKDQYAPDCGNGTTPDGKSNVKNDPNDVSVPVDPSFMSDWVKHVMNRYGAMAEGGLAVWELDNEPTWWMAVHKDIHPNAATYDETLALNIQAAAAIKSVDPTALIGGATPPGWESYFFSARDLQAGWATGPDYKYWNNPVDRKAHDNLEYLAWYLREMQKYEATHGIRLIDYLDVHGYIAPDKIEFGRYTGDPAVDDLRLQSTREFWDPNYMPPREDMQKQNLTPQLIPRLRKWVSDYYPGTKTAITEYNWGAMEHITGAIAQADLLGIFGREGLDLATLWGPPTPAQPGAFAYRIFLDYDQAGGRFGETSVQAVSGNPDQLSVFAAERSDHVLTVLVLNKSRSALSSQISLANFMPSAAAQVWRYTSDNQSAIVRGTDQPVDLTGFNASFAPYSLTLFVIPPQAQSVPKPVLTAVVNAASYASAVVPGEIVSLFGQDLGPDPAVLQPALSSPNSVAQQLGGARVLFDGVPAVLTAAAKNQVNAIVPYFISTRATVHIQVENQGVRSEWMEVPVAQASPGIFTANGSGKGQGSILNVGADGSVTVNTPQTPVARGGYISVFLTGEGLTDPPGVDGRIATRLLPKPLLPVTATIDGKPATVLYAGAAPQGVAGLMQVNLQVPANASTGAVAVDIIVGVAHSQTGVTVSVQ